MSSDPIPTTERFGLNSKPQMVCPAPVLVPGLSSVKDIWSAVGNRPEPVALPANTKLLNVRSLIVQLKPDALNMA